MYIPYLRSTPCSKKTLTRFFSGFEIITRVFLQLNNLLVSLSILYNTISAIVFDPEKNRV